MGIPEATCVQTKMLKRAEEAKGDLSWLAAYYASLKIFQKTPEQGGTPCVPLPDRILSDPDCLKPGDPIKKRFVDVFSHYASVKPAHDFGHYINLSPVVFAVAILEEFVEHAYFLRTGGASLKKPDGKSRSLNRYLDILCGKEAEDLVQHPNHVVVEGIEDICQNVRFLAKRRHEISHAYRGASFDANVASVGFPRLAQAVTFVDEVTHLLLTKTRPRSTVTPR